ncbi:MAG: hypothetical protein ACI4SF_12615 [Oscillospiraceae bacterium]
MLKFLSSQTAAPVNYQKTTETAGAIEAKYMADGNYDVSAYEETALQGFKKYVIYYPSEIETADRIYPIIVMCNGSGTPISKYTAVAKHFASWGFVVIGTEEENDWNGFSAEMCVRHLQRLNENETTGDNANIFYQKIDLENVGIVGHSQGGVGVFNAITSQDHKETYKAAVSLSPTNKELAHNLEWDYDASLIDTPIMLMSGAGGGDDWVVTGEQLAEIFDDISCGKVSARRKDTPHGEMLYSANGYITAWFMWHLQNDEEAAGAFIGNDPEIMTNSLYQDQKIVSLDKKEVLP